VEHRRLSNREERRQQQEEEEEEQEEEEEDQEEEEASRTAAQQKEKISPLTRSLTPSAPGLRRAREMSPEQISDIIKKVNSWLRERAI